jgi:iron complex outermembrane receptor protein
MKTKIGLLVLFIFFIQKAGIGQVCDLTIHGKISLEGNGIPDGATITLQTSGEIFITDPSGDFTFGNLCPGNYVLEVRFVGHQSLRDTILLNTSVLKNYLLRTDNIILGTITIQDDHTLVEENRNVSVLNRNQLDAVAGKSLGETLKEVSGVSTLQSGPGIFKPVIHGVHSQRVLILNHGVRQEGQQWGAEHAPEIDPFMATEIQVVKDAAAIRYGADAIGGVVILNPPQLPTSPGLGGYFQTIGQSNGRSMTTSGSLQGGIKKLKDWGWRVQGTQKKSGDFHTPDYNLRNTGIREKNISMALGRHNSHGGFEIYGSHFSTTIGILQGIQTGNLEDLATLIQSGKPNFISSFQSGIAAPKQEASHNLLKLNAHQSNERGTWQFNYAFQENKRKEFDIRRGDLSGIPAINLKLQTHTIESGWEPAKGKAFRLGYGVTGMYQYNQNIAGTQRIPFIPDYKNFSGGTYGILNFKGERIDWDMGLRFDARHYDVAGFDFSNTLYRRKLTFMNFSSTAGLKWKIKLNQELTSSLSSAWRPPHVSELFSLGTHQSAAAIEYGLLLDAETNRIRAQQNIQLNNEKAFKWVVGWNHFKGPFSLHANAYANYILNYFYLKPGGISKNLRGAYPFFRYQQTNAIFAGADLETELKISGSLKSQFKATYLYASDLTNQDRFLFIPANRTEAVIVYEKPYNNSRSKFSFETKARFVFRQYRAPRVINPQTFINGYSAGVDPLQGDTRNFDFLTPPSGYFLLGVSAGYTVTENEMKYDFRIGSENLLNNSYRDYTNRFRYYADELGRNILISLKVIF